MSFPVAPPPPPMLPPMPQAPKTTPATLKPVVVLLFVNLGLSALIAGLVFLTKDSILDYQLARLAETDARGADPASARGILESALWVRPIAVLVAAAVYLRLALKLKKGKRWTHIQLLSLAGFGALGIVFLIVTTAFPVWVKVIQGGQVAVLLALFAVLLTRNVRTHFGPRPAPYAAY